VRDSTDRYDRDRLRFDLALRMTLHGARTRTISAWTGLSIARLRKLYRAYLAEAAGRTVEGTVLEAPARSRRRGQAPQYATCFLQPSALRFEATTLAGLFCIVGLISRESGTAKSVTGAVTPERAEIFCQVYEAYKVLHPVARLSFEYAWFLLLALAKKKGIKLNVCGQCGRLYLADRVRAKATNCGCGKWYLGLPRRH
jgi:hypothetical protein